MTETLFRTSTVLLFGRVVEDLAFGFSEIEADAATAADMANLRGLDAGDGNTLKEGTIILVRAQQNNKQNGIYKVGPGPHYVWDREPLQPERGSIIKVKEGDLKGYWKRLRNGNPKRFKFKLIERNKLGKNNFLEYQLEGMVVARIYGFTYEGTYYDLPKAVLFGVHGEGEPASLASQVGTEASLARAPRDPSVSGVGAADFHLADEIRVWAYDKADYTIRLDVETGMFEQVLLDAFFDGGRMSGAMVSGAMVGGPGTRGAMVRGAMVSGAMLRGRRGGRGDPSD